MTKWHFWRTISYFHNDSEISHRKGLKEAEEAFAENFGDLQAKLCHRQSSSFVRCPQADSAFTLLVYNSQAHEISDYIRMQLAETELECMQLKITVNNNIQIDHEIVYSANSGAYQLVFYVQDIPALGRWT